MMKICILATGGTIDKIHDPISESLVFAAHSCLPDLLEECRVDQVALEVLMLKDSAEFTDEDREAILTAILNRPERLIILTHGTSTMTQTQGYLDGRVGDKTIILTGAMRPPSLFQSDAGFNLGSAIMAARLSAAGVYITMNGQIFKAGEVQKNTTLGRFEGTS